MGKKKSNPPPPEGSKPPPPPSIRVDMETSKPKDGLMFDSVHNSPEANAITFRVGDTEMVIDDQGMEYAGVRIDDAGEAHRAFINMMTAMESDLTQKTLSPLKIALKDAMNYVECTDGRSGCLKGLVVASATYDEWKRLSS